MAITTKQEDGTNKQTYVGAVLDTREYNGYNDSDFYAVVWDDTQGIIEVEYGSTRYHSDSYATADATAEVVEKANRWASEKLNYICPMYSAKRAEKKIEVGSEVVVCKGRKVAHGFAGRITWVGMTKFGKRVRIQPAKGEAVFTAIENVCLFAVPVNFENRKYTWADYHGWTKSLAGIARL